ncbi:MAG: iron ABC transporter permease, partial [Desulfobacteraceae bacterium]|nr:iron ABC transporter permease [Desulfobacteraceae bacterium]
MHFDDGVLPEEYSRYIGKKIIFITIALICLVLIFVVGISLGAVKISFIDVVKSLAGVTISKRFDIIIFNIR